LTGRVNDGDGKPLAQAQVGMWLKAGNTYDQLDQEMVPTDSQGRYEIKCVPADGQYIVWASNSDHGRSQQSVTPDTETNRMELLPLVLKLADRIVAGQVVNGSDKPLSGVNVSLSGEGQPQGNTTTDSKGRFHFKVCEGQIQIFANSQEGFAQARVDAGDTNIIMTISQNNNGLPQPAHHTSFKGSPLPDLATVNLEASAAPADKAVLLCLFDASQRPSRHVVSQLEQQAAGLRQQGITVLAVQAAITTDDIFNQWKSGSPVSCPIDRVTEQNAAQAKWASNASALPWLILTDAHHRVIAEGFAMDDLDAQVKKLSK
jgi:hypothetical protein